MKRKIELYTVRNNKGQLLGRYYALTSEQAIQKEMAGQASTASAFRKSQPMMNRRIDTELTATVEQ